MTRLQLWHPLVSFAWWWSRGKLWIVCGTCSWWGDSKTYPAYTSWALWTTHHLSIRIVFGPEDSITNLSLKSYALFIQKCCHLILFFHNNQTTYYPPYQYKHKYTKIQFDQIVLTMLSCARVLTATPSLVLYTCWYTSARLTAAPLAFAYMMNKIHTINTKAFMLLCHNKQ